MLTRALPAAAQDINVNGEVVIKHVLPKTALDDHSDIEGEFHEIDSKGG
jgi:hypothetical protein